MQGAIFAAVNADEMRAGELLADAGMTVLIGIVIVLAMLVVLTAIFTLFGVVMSAGKKKGKVNVPSPAVVTARAATPVVSAPVAAAAPADAEDEVIAVIAAAIAAMTPVGKRYAVRSVVRAQDGRAVWAASGTAQNVSPF